jgi:capsular polysaccharide biosynthesis protein
MRVVVGAFTIIFGVLLVYALEKADHTLDRREDVHRFLGVKVLASIPERR